jgi:phosphoribosylformylglycinamidine cyclo-ligase
LTQKQRFYHFTMTQNPEGRYAARGVSASKADVHKAVDHLDRGLYPKAFCKITPDHFTGLEDRCTVIHSDGSGSKSILAYLWYRETQDPSVFEGIAQDSIVMNIDDLLCVGVRGQLLLSSTINRNANTCDADVIAAIIGGNEKFIKQMQSYGLDVVNGGGETADMGDSVRTITVDTCAVASLPKKEVIAGGIVPGLSIVGLSSSGQASYENTENSGVGSNGLTSARHDLLCSHYRETYPEAWAPEIDSELAYCGPYRLKDPLPGSSLSVGEALLSPTRSYAPVILKMLKEAPKAVAGLIHCTGGAQTKCLRFGEGVHFIKDNLFPAPALFSEIQKHSGTSLQEMYQVYNMGHRMEVYCREEDAEQLIQISKSFHIDAKVIGKTEASKKEDGSCHLTIKAQGKELNYELP